VVDPRGDDSLEEPVEPDDDHGHPPASRLRLVRLDEQRGVLVDVPEDLIPGAHVRVAPEEPGVPIDAGIQVGHGHARDQVGDGAHRRRG
jgi:hypothetical protein